MSDRTRPGHVLQPATDRARSGAAAYLVVQAAATVVWWALITASPAIRQRFELAADRPEVLDAFMAGDAVLLVAGSILAAIATKRRTRSAAALTALVAGGSAYSTLYLAAWVAFGGHGSLGLVLMTLATAANAWVVFVVRATGR